MGPAIEVVVDASFFKVSCELEEHTPFVIVHFKIVLLPAVTPVTVEVLDVGVVMVPGPLTILHKPVPPVGVLPARVNVLVLHNS